MGKIGIFEMYLKYQKLVALVKVLFILMYLCVCLVQIFMSAFYLHRKLYAFYRQILSHKVSSTDFQYLQHQVGFLNRVANADDAVAKIKVIE